jgi:hypothetical protein
MLIYFLFLLLVSVSAGMEVRMVSTLFDRFNSTEASRWCVGYIHETVVDHVTCIFVSLYFFVFLCCYYIHWTKVLIYFYLSCLLIVYIG